MTKCIYPSNLAKIISLQVVAVGEDLEEVEAVSMDQTVQVQVAHRWMDSYISQKKKIESQYMMSRDGWPSTSIEWERIEGAIGTRKTLAGGRFRGQGRALAWGHTAGAKDGPRIVPKADSIA